MQEYWLRSHVHICVTEDHAVLLDLQRDKYIGIGPGQAEILAARVKGWPRSEGRSVKQTTGAQTAADTSLMKMLDAGMLTTDPAFGKEARPIAVPRPERTLTQEDLEARPKPTPGHIAHFLSASVAAKAKLKWRPIQTLVAAAKARKQRHQPPGIDVELARLLVEDFLYLRPLLFATRDQCLYDSYALIEFLAGYAIYPTWIFGVQTRPFLAHSWVQHEGIVFNDTPDYVHRFTPIMAV